MPTAQATTPSSDLAPDAYVVIGIASCFVREDKELHPIEVIEPIPSAMLEALNRGIPTSYKLAFATTLGAVWQDGQPQRLAEYPESAQFCDEFALRVASAARTYKARPAAQNLIPSGTVRDDFNFSLDRKRVLNLERQVTKEDNVKQHSHTHQVL
ncbi:hypothetical protein [Vacuolonema iberomarrocanum]|uniref:hypothetical protein n=1 Tax=Vacuolonema iberomarrocanum TaxID=3454632 RepID=UPI0019EB8019|nr:hypothetical protein [filamentous cyanobacterium LEGE 07170]